MMPQTYYLINVFKNKTFQMIFFITNYFFVFCRHYGQCKVICCVTITKIDSLDLGGFSDMLILISSKWFPRSMPYSKEVKTEVYEVNSHLLISWTMSIDWSWSRIDLDHGWILITDWSWSWIDLDHGLILIMDWYWSWMDLDHGLTLIMNWSMIIQIKPLFLA